LDRPVTAHPFTRPSDASGDGMAMGKSPRRANPHGRTCAMPVIARAPSVDVAGLSSPEVTGFRRLEAQRPVCVSARESNWHHACSDSRPLTPSP
jgi:hypothetical protein